VTDDRPAGLAHRHKAVRKAIERCLASSDQRACALDSDRRASDEDYREVRAGEILREEMQVGLERAQKDGACACEQGGERIAVAAPAHPQGHR
jgi:hypothetical protein